MTGRVSRGTTWSPAGSSAFPPRASSALCSPRADLVSPPFPHCSPSLIANLWDVTDRDIDRLSEAVLGSLHLDGSAAPDGQAGGLSTAQAVAAARTECKLRFLTGAAPVVYGVPVWAA